MAARRSHGLSALAAVLLLPAAASGAQIPLTSFDFENGVGGPDAQGWQPGHEFHPDQAYAHVEDFTGADHEGAPLAGAQSFWWGLTAEDPRTCHWAAPPGYGSFWNEVLVSRLFEVQGDVEIGFLADQYIDTGYDGAALQYEEPAGTWNTLHIYDCGFSDCGPTVESFVIPAASHDGNLRFRFHFFSDGAVDNEGAYFAGVFDIGFTLDSLTVSDATGVLDFQDFESEAPGDSITADGDWHTEVFDKGPHHALLADGTTVLQQTVEQNGTHLWGLFDESPYDYACAGHPEQPVVPETRSGIRSPYIDVYTDAGDNPVNGVLDSIVVDFDVYLEEEPNHKVALTWFESWGDDCLVDRLDSGWNSSSEEGTGWVRARMSLVPDPGTTRIRLWFGVRNTQFTGADCRSHAPLYDNVDVAGFFNSVTATDPAPAVPAFGLRQNRPNPFNPRTRIEYAVPANAARVRLRIYDTSGRLVRTLVNGTSPAGPRHADWDGRTDSGEPAASGVYYYELLIDDRREARKMVLLK